MLIIPRGNHGNQRKANRHWRSLGVGRTRKRMHVSLWAESFQLARDSLAQSPWPPESRSCVISYSSGRNVEARPGHRTRPRAPTHLVLEHDSVLSFSHLVTFPVTFPSIIKRSVKKVIHCDVQWEDSHCFFPYLSSIHPSLSQSSLEASIWARLKGQT